MKRIDRAAITRYGIPGMVLMENAGRGVVQVIEHCFDMSLRPRITIVCGTGNNGGDGMVVCRHLLAAGASPRLFLVGRKDRVKGDAKVNMSILERSGVPVTEMDGRIHREFSSHLRQADLVVDALFGTGFKGRLSGLAATVVDRINRSSLPVVSVDCPSGIDADTGRVGGECVKAELTVTMGLPKVGLLLYPGRSLVGELWVADIGIPESVIGEQAIQTKVVDLEEVSLPERDPAGHKTTFGWVVVIAGSPGMTGAGAMASRASLRCGAGMATLCLPRNLNSALEAKLTEVMTYPLPETRNGTISLDALKAAEPIIEKADVLVVGPGLSTDAETSEMVCSLLERVDLPIVVDADALSALAGKLDLLKRRVSPTILTPHPGEMSRLTGLPVDRITNDRLAVASQFSNTYRVITVLKGAPTVLASPDGHCFLNITGNSGLATAGSGDVLSGMIAGMLAQGLDPIEAGKTSVYLHGLAGDLSSSRVTEYSVVATDLLESIPEAIRASLESEKMQFQGGVRNIL
jgi:NAD(P)H-hydrate epimerase